MAQNELGAFIRTRREAVQPADVGLPPGQRRRTPGLRRAELAMLAGVSVEYLTRLEQGRDRRPSMEILAALADALRLSMGDRDLLIRAAKSSGGNACPAAVTAPASEIRAPVRLMLERLEPTPAIVINRLTDVLARTSGYERLAEPTGLLDRPRLDPVPNLARFVFADSRAAAVYPDWGETADELVAGLTYDAKPNDEHLAALASELEVLGGAAFSMRFTSTPRSPRRRGVQRMVHPYAGELRLSYESLALPDDGQRLLIYLPADDATAGLLDQIAGREPGGLRVVSG